VRTWGRTYSELGVPTWVEVTTNAQGYNDEVYLTTLAQTLKLNLGESPFFGNYGIPAHPDVVQQVWPDYYVAFTQKQFSQYFASLLVTRLDYPYPRYQINITTQQGFKMNASVPIPT
jgi:hypothetical protein